MENFKLNKLKEDSNLDNSWKEDFQFQIENEECEDFFFEISLRIITRLDELGWKKNRLAKELRVSNQYVSKLLQAKHHIGVPTIYKIQKLLGIRLIQLPDATKKTLNIIKLEIKPSAFIQANSSFSQSIYPNQQQYINTSKWQKDQKSTFPCRC